MTSALQHLRPGNGFECALCNNIQETILTYLWVYRYRLPQHNVFFFGKISNVIYTK